MYSIFVTILFVVFVVFYLTYNTVNIIDKMYISMSLIILFYTILISYNCNNNVENFDEPNKNLSEVLSSSEMIDMEEDISKIEKNLVLYYTAFNTLSYPSFGKSWKNITKSKQSSNTCNEKLEDSKNLSFDLAPIYARKTGFLLGSNRIYGPYSNSLGIDFNRAYTFVIVVKHGNIGMTSNDIDDIELFKLYANSPNNNALSLYIDRESLELTDMVQKGKLFLQYTNKNPIQCVLSKNDTSIVFNKDSVSFYYITKDYDYIRIMYMTERSSTVWTLCHIPLFTEDITFSNKELIINRYANWNANIYSFAIYNAAFTDEDATYFQSNYLTQFTKNVNQSYINMMNKYNTVVNTLQSITKCQFDENTCNICSSVDDWTDVNKILKSSPQCKNAIDNYCKANPTHNFCKCWDTKQVMYNTNSCKIFRSLFGDNNACITNLSEDDIQFIKSKHKLITVDECPKDIEVPKNKKNKYEDYDFERLKINIDSSQYKNNMVLPKIEVDNTTISKNIQKESENIDVNTSPGSNINITQKYNETMNGDSIDKDVNDMIYNTRNNSNEQKHIEGPNQGFYNSFMRMMGL